MVNNEYVKLASLLDGKKVITISPSFKLKNDEILPEGKTMVISQDQEYSVGYTNKSDEKLNKPPYVLFGDHTECFKWVENPFAQGADGVKILKSNSDEISDRYLYYALLSCYNKTGFYERHFKLLRKTLIPNYDRKKQDKIVNILSKYDEKIENNNKRIKILEQMAENLYKEWFVRFRFPGYENAEFENGIPKGWKFVKLKEVVKEVGKSIKKENREDYEYYLPIDFIPNKSMALRDVDSIKNAESSLQVFKQGDILFVAMRPYFHKVLYAPFKGITRKTCFVLNTKDKKYLDYLYCLLYQKSSVDFANTVSVGSTMPYVRWQDFSRMNALLPQENIVIEFSKHVSKILNRMRIFFFENLNLQKQRDALLPKLMSGKLEI